jgi:hypothetical protein
MNSSTTTKIREAISGLDSAFVVSFSSVSSHPAGISHASSDPVAYTAVSELKDW